MATLTQTGQGYQVNGSGQYYSNYNDALAAYNSAGSSNSGPSAPITATTPVDPYKAYQDSLLGVRSTLDTKYGFKQAQDARAAAQKGLTDFQFQDLSKVFKDEADRLGLTEISNSIASLSKERQKQQRTLEDLPDTILGISRDVGISEAQLNRQTAVESRPIIRNISDLLSSVSILGDQYNRGMQQAQYSTDLAGRQDQANFSKLGQAYGFANDNYNDVNNTINQLFGPLAAGITTPAQQAAAAEAKRQAELDEKYRRDSLLQDESQFSRSLAQDADQFNRTPRGGGPSGPSYGETVQAALAKFDMTDAQQQKDAFNFVRATAPASVTDAQIRSALGIDTISAGSSKSTWGRGFFAKEGKSLVRRIFGW